MARQHPITAKDIPWTADEPSENDRLAVTTREFQSLGDQRYTLAYEPVGITFVVERLNRKKHELHGEVSIRVNGNFPNAKTTNGVLNSGSLNFSSIRSREERAKHLDKRSSGVAVDWSSLLEEFCLRVVEAEREGSPAIDLSTWAPPPGQDRDRVVEIAGFPLLLDHPNLVFSEGGAGKSYFAMYLAGCLAQMDIPVLYCDWEFSMDSHGRRYQEMFRPRPKGLHYARCERPLTDEVDRIVGLIAKHQIGFIVFDSMGFACEGRPEEAENANNYFRAVRAFRLGSLHLSHISKRDDEHKGSAPFGSVYWLNSVRSAWFLQKAQHNPENQLSLVLVHKKHNTTRALAPRAYTLNFERDGMTTLAKANIHDIEELAASLPLHERLKKLLEGQGLMHPKDIAEELGVPIASVRVMPNRFPTIFTRIGKKIGVSYGF